MTDAANAMFPAMSQTTESPPAVTAQTEPEAPRPRTDDEIARVMFDPEIQYRQQLREPLAKLVNEHGLDDTTAAAYHKAAANVFADMELSPPAVSEWADLIAQHAAGVDEETSGAWAAEALDAARRQYGAAEADRRFAAANEVLTRYPGFRDLLKSTRLGNHPRIVAHLVERAPALLGKLRAKAGS